MPQVNVATCLREFYRIPSGAYAIDEVETVRKVGEALNSRYPGIKGDFLAESGGVGSNGGIELGGRPIELSNTGASVAGTRTVRIVWPTVGG